MLTISKLFSQYRLHQCGPWHVGSITPQSHFKLHHGNAVVWIWILYIERFVVVPQTFLYRISTMWQSFKSYWSGHYYTPIKTYTHTHMQSIAKVMQRITACIYTACTTLMNYSWANRNAASDWLHRKVGGDLPKNNKKVKTRRCKSPRPWWDLNQRNRAPASVRSLQACTVFAVHNRNVGCVWPRNTNGLGT